MVIDSVGDRTETRGYLRENTFRINEANIFGVRVHGSGDNPFENLGGGAEL